MTKEVLMQEVKRVADLLKVDYSSLSDAELFSMVTGVTVASFDEVTEDRLAFLYKLIPGGAFADSADDAAVEGDDEEPEADPVAAIMFVTITSVQTIIADASAHMSAVPKASAAFSAPSPNAGIAVPIPV